MGDHFVLLVDRLLTESTLEAAIESRKSLKQAAIDETLIDCSPRKECEASLSPRKLVECRICQDEDVNSNMESPCSCCGSLKYAHRKCVQRWCNEKGDTVCEICHQQFKPGYTAPPPIFRFREIPMNLRGNWQIARRDLANPRLVTMASTDQNFLDPDYDEYEFSTRRSIIFCRSIAIIFMILLILRHTLPIIFSRAENYSCPLIVLLLLRIAGIILPICIILKAVTSIICHRQQVNEANLSITPSDEEAGQFTPHQLHVTPVY
ncbi:uncharacterized protein LOC111399016 isoform X2 [Olea europaea var. sylvestris]|uniref:uncharacterized protein LOC111399016 isoform X2 n=1 Tax=Olea europaea var. sylvestris TaxID=158386 RepID=UPI000C1D7D36|nr:uncharacterized protein LOC111399016 isoform X2 [Olea europaea var. sylvestris]